MRPRYRLRLVPLCCLPCGGAAMVLKIWLGALVALIAFFCLQALVQEHSEHLERIPVVRHI